MAVKTASCTYSYLSHDVYELIVAVPPGTSYITGRFLALDLSLKWDEIESVFKSVDRNMTNPTKGVFSVKEIAAEMAVILELPIEEYMLKSRFSHLIQWTGHSCEIVESLHALKSGRPCGAVLSVLLSTSFLERVLGDLYICVSGDEKCPSLLKDLLAKDELCQLLGPAPIYLLSCLMGPPTTLNLRNITWHGFFIPKELHPQYAMLLLTIIVSIGALLERTRYASELSHRSQAEFKQLSVLENVCHSQLELSGLTGVTDFIDDMKIPIWEEAIMLWKSKRYGLFVVLILPELEHGLRRIFAQVNNCPHRVLTAESSLLFTTFDEILSPCLENGASNNIPGELGASIMEMLQDLLVHPAGLRLRDRVSHGEVDLASCPPKIAQFVLEVSVRLCSKYALHSTPAGTLKEYKSLFHPSSLLQQMVLSAMEELTQWDTIPTPEDLASSLEDAPPRYREGCMEVAAKIGFMSDIHKFLAEGGPFIQAVWSSHVQTLFTPRHHLEVVGILRQILVSCLQSTNQVFSTATERCKQFLDKSLRSRQRSNYQRLLQRLSVYKFSIMMCLLIVTWQMKALKNYSKLDIQQLVKHLKKILSCCENIASQTAKYRWEETEVLCTSLVDIVSRLSNTHTGVCT